MTIKIAYITILVNDYDEAIAFYTNKLGFKLIEDTRLSESKRWVLVSPSDSDCFCLLLAKADNEIQRSRIGNQTGGRERNGSYLRTIGLMLKETKKQSEP